MGFAIALTACAANDRDRFLGAAGLAETGTSDPENEALLSGAVAGDHYLTWRNLRLTKRLSDPNYALMSRTLPFTVLSLHEGSMGAELARFEDGRADWKLSGSHDHGLSVEGEPPFTLDAVREDVRCLWSGMDIELDKGEDPGEDAFAVTVEGFVRLTGFRYDTVHDLPFQELQGEMPFPKRWWQFW